MLEQSAMPLPSDEKLLALSRDLLAQFDTIFGLHPGFRPAHAKGILLTGTFTPSSDAASLTRAPHLSREPTPVTVRFSNSTGVPLMPDNDPHANPRGLAVRFNLAEHVHTDIISHSADGFPNQNRSGIPRNAARHRIVERSIKAVSIASRRLPWSAHPAALAFVQTPETSFSELWPRSLTSALAAFRFTEQGWDQTGTGGTGLPPDAGVEAALTERRKQKIANFCFDVLPRGESRRARSVFRFEVRISR